MSFHVEYLLGESSGKSLYIPKPNLHTQNENLCCPHTEKQEMEVERKLEVETGNRNENATF